MSRLLLLLTLTYTYVKSMPLRPQEGQPVVHDHYNRIPNVGLRSMKEQIMITAHEQSIQSDKPELPIATDATASATPTSCINGFQTYPDTTWNLMGLPYTVAYTVQACIDICNAAGSACAAAQWYNSNACVKFTQTQTVGQVMTSSPDPKLPRTLITRCTGSTQTPATQTPATQAPATQAPATQAPTTAPTSSSSCPNGFNTYSGTYDLMGLPYTVAYTGTACLNLCQAQSSTTCAAAVWYNGNACVMYTSSQAAGKVVMPSPDPNLPRTVFVRCSTVVTSTQAPATQAPATQAPTKAPTPAPTQAPTKAPTPAPTQAPTPAPTRAPTPAPTQAPTKAPTSYPILTPDTAPPGSHGLPYKGGSVMTNAVRVYLVYYGSWSTTTAKQEAVSIINTFVSNLGTSPWWNIQTTYYYPNPSTGVRTYVQNGFKLGGYVVTPLDSTAGGTSLSDSNIATIISKQINTGKLPYDADGVYIMISSNEVSNSGFCSSNCGWHSATYVSGSSRIIAYGWVGDASTQCPGSCTAFGSSPSPNNNKAADGIISILAHEIAEAVSDPMLSAWVGNDYQENADKCAWNFLSTYTTSNGARANMNIAGRDYLVQANWKNRDGGGCVLRL